MGAFHLEAARRLKNGETEDYYKGDLSEHIRRLQICGVCDIHPDAYQQRELKDVPFYTQWLDLLCQQHPQLAVIATPTKTHFEIGKQALEHGAHCLIEKPLTSDFQECQTLFNTASTHGCRLLAGHVERYNPVTIKLRSLMEKDNLKLDNYRFTRSQKLPERIADDIIVDKLIHDLDLALYLFGSVVEVKVISSQKIDNRIVEAEIELQHHQGTTGRLFVSWLTNSNEKIRQVWMRSSDNTIITGDFVAKKLEMNNRPVQCGVRGWIQPVNNQIKDQLADFLAYCLEPRSDIPPPLLSPEEIKNAIHIIDEVHQLNN